MTEQTPEPDRSDDSETPEADPQGLDLGTQETEYFKKDLDPEDVQTRDRD
jgi:hypothetical protein